MSEAKEAATSSRRVADPELKAMNDMAKLMEAVEDPEARSRILYFVLGRYAPAGFEFSRKPAQQ